MLLACSNMTSPASSSSSGACHPPCVKPPSRSSSGAPGACATPSSVTNSVTMSLPMVSSFSWRRCTRSDSDHVREPIVGADPTSGMRRVLQGNDELACRPAFEYRPPP